jgi:OmpA-OmpF porin, OOP family
VGRLNPGEARVTIRVVKTLFCLFLIALIPLPLAAQTAAVKDAPGCHESAVLTRMPGCSITRCVYKEYDAAQMPLKQNDRQHSVEGEYEQTLYRCPAGVSPLQIIRNAENALRSAGFTIHYSDKYATTRYWVTAQKGPQWVYAYADGVQLDLKTVKTKAMEQVMQANAEGWAQAIQNTGRASIYGIQFDTGKATVKPESEATLQEVAKLLMANPSWFLVIAGHTDNVGAKAMNLTLSRQRAEAVVTWLASHGASKDHLVSAGFGDGSPLADNATDEGRAKNRRVDLVKIY